MASGMSTMDAIYWFEAKRAMIDNFASYVSSHRLSDETKAAWRHDNEIKVQAYTVALKALRAEQEKEMKEAVNG